MENTQGPFRGKGKICYLEIPAADILTSANFYKDVFGWKIRQRSDGHLAFDDTTGEVSGSWVTGREPITTPGLLVYIMVDDINETINSITNCGGRIVRPAGLDAPEITARFCDPAGNIFGLYQEPG